MASSRTASIRRRSRSSPPSRRKAAKNCAGRRTSGSNRPASRSCPAEKPRFPFATIFLPPPMGIVRRHRTGDLGPHDYHAPGFRKNTPQHEKAWAKKLAVLIRTRRGRQGFSRVELDHGGGGPGQGAVRARDAVDGADHQVLALRAGKAAGRPPVPLPGEGRAAEEDAGPAEVIPPGRMA